MKLKMEKWKTFYDELYMDKSKLDQLVELFQLLFCQSCYEIFGFKYYNSNEFKWISKKVLRLLDDKKKWKNKLSHLIAQTKRKLGLKGVKTAMGNIRKNISRNIKQKWKQIKHKIQKLNKKIFKSKQESILTSTAKIEKAINKDGAKNDKLFWSISNKLTKSVQNMIPPQRDEKSDKIVATKMKDILKHIHNHFISPVKRNLDDYLPRHKRFYEKVEKWMDKYKFNRNQSNSILIENIHNKKY